MHAPCPQAACDASVLSRISGLGLANEQRAPRGQPRKPLPRTYASIPDRYAQPQPQHCRPCTSDTADASRKLRPYLYTCTFEMSLSWARRLSQQLHCHPSSPRSAAPCRCGSNAGSGVGAGCSTSVSGMRHAAAASSTSSSELSRDGRGGRAPVAG